MLTADINVYATNSALPATRTGSLMVTN